MKLDVKLWILSSIVLILPGSLAEDIPEDGKLAEKSKKKSAMMLCRTDDDGLLRFSNEYKWNTCGRCYSQLAPSYFISPEVKMEYKNGFLWETNIVNGTIFYGRSYRANPKDLQSPIYRTFNRRHGDIRWLECCIAAYTCCYEMSKDPPLIEDKKNTTKYCDRTWDGYTCIKDTTADNRIKFECPDFMFWTSSQNNVGYGTRYCNKDGRWKNVTENRFSNYTDCLRVQKMENDLENKSSTSQKNHSFSCSTDEDGLLSFPHQYRYNTCARCYSYMPTFLFKSPEHRLEYKDGLLWETNLVNESKIYLKSHRADTEDFDGIVYKSFAGYRGAWKWVLCCESAYKCCVKMLEDPVTIGKRNKFCKRTWDGWSCVPDTPGGEQARLPCMEHIYFASNPTSCQKYATRECSVDGKWLRTSDGKGWSNYVTCGKAQELMEKLYIHIGAYAVTIITILPALLILLCHRQLQSHRIRLHKHFFTSLFLNAISVVTFKLLLASHIVDSQNSLISSNVIGCKFLYMITRYFRMTNYTWMFCEGYYLHKLIASAFAEQDHLLPFYFIGWGCPLIAIAVYSAVRVSLSDSHCWVKPVGDYEWIINAPNLICLAVNLCFLCNIIRVLWSKLRARYANEPSHFRKTVKATLVLFPLFGGHFILVLYRPQLDGECLATKIHFIIYYLIDGLQGAVVACIYCYMNGEVRTALKRSYTRFRQSLEVRQSNRRLMNSRTQSFSTNVSSMVENQPHQIKAALCLKNGKRGELEMTVIQE